MSGKITIDGKKIKKAREELGRKWSQSYLAEQATRGGLELNRDQVANLEGGRSKSLSFLELKILASILNKEMDYFASDPKDLERYTIDERRISVVGVVNAGTFNFSYDMPPETTLPLRLDVAGDRRAVAMRISGDCMINPADPKGSLYDGDYIVIIQPKADEPINGVIAVVRLNGDECTLKRVFKTKDGYELRPDNPKYKSIFIKGDIHVEGVKLAKWSP